MTRGNPDPVGNHGPHNQRELDCPRCGQPVANLPNHLRACSGGDGR